MLYDTHSHPYLAKDLSETEVIERFFQQWWVCINSIWCDIESSQRSVNLAKKYTGIYASIGIHPTHVLDYKDTEISEIISWLEQIYNNNKKDIVAIWETWLDYYWLESLSSRYNMPEAEIIKIQKKYFVAQIWLAKKLNLPIIIHNRASSEDIFTILKEQKCTNFVFHCFSEDLEYALKLIDLAPECKLWFGGVVTFKNAQKTQELVRNIDLKHIIIETDSPYLTPAPFRWKRENEPILIKEVLSKIIELRSEPSQLITQQIFENSTNFFGIKN